jgi:hypothetical protein
VLEFAQILVERGFSQPVAAVGRRRMIFLHGPFRD